MNKVKIESHIGCILNDCSKIKDEMKGASVQALAIVDDLEATAGELRKYIEEE